MSANVVPGGLPGEVFIPNGKSRKDTAVLLIGTAEEYGIDSRRVRATALGFYVPADLGEIVKGDEPAVPDDDDEGDYYDPADYTVSQVQEFVSEYPDLAADILASEEAGKNRSTLVEWLTEFNKTSGDRAAKNTGTDKE